MKNIIVPFGEKIQRQKQRFANILLSLYKLACLAQTDYSAGDGITLPIVKMRGGMKPAPHICFHVRYQPLLHLIFRFIPGRTCSAYAISGFDALLLFFLRFPLKLTDMAKKAS